MIYTVTLNPSIDYCVSLDKLRLGYVNRSSNENVYPGGKGINVSIMLNELGYESSTLGFISGFTGDFIKDILSERNIKTDFIDVKNGFSRINLKLNSKEETEINGSGPNIDEVSLNELFKKLKNIKEGDILVLAGSIPYCLNEDLYERIISILENKNIKVVVDATKNLLLNVLKYKPFLIKPNNHELEEIFNTKLNSTDDIVFYAKKLKEMGAKNVLVSLGKEGAILVNENDDVLKSNVAGGTVKNSVGAGDSMVAGFIAGYIKNNDYEEALKLGACCGCATAFSADIAKKYFIDELISEIEVKKI